jgi:hypothetical protein
VRLVEGKLSNTEDLNNLLGCTPIKFSSAAEALAKQQTDRLTFWPIDSRRDVLWAIEHSGLFFGLACDPALLADDSNLIRTKERLGFERSAQASLAAAGITNTATAIAWIDSVIPSIDRDLAELKEIDDRHQRERQAFFDRKSRK